MILALDTQQIIWIVCIAAFLLAFVVFITIIVKKKKRNTIAAQKEAIQPVQKEHPVEKSKENFVESTNPVQDAPVEEIKETIEEPTAPVQEEGIVPVEESKESLEETPITSHKEEPETNERVVAASPFFQSKAADPNATVFIVMYNKSMKAKVSMGTPECRQFYQELKSYLLSYGLKSRISWSYDSIYLGRIPFAKLSIRGKTLSMNIALDPTGYEGGMYEDCHELKKYADVPLRIKIKSNRSLKLAKQAIDLLASTRGYAIKEEVSNCEIEPVRGLKENLQLGLVKKLKMKQAVSLSSISADDLEDLEISVDAAETVKQVIVTKKCSGKKEIINLDTISKNYKENEVVSLTTLVEKHLVSPKAKAVKCLARGILDKPLHFELNDYSNDAVKMILVTGGTIE